MTPHQFIAKWQAADLKERAACQEHFLDLCGVLGEPTPAAADPTGAWFTFEKGVSKDTGGQGYADVWRRNCFGWEYKGKKKNLADAYRQLTQYREALGNPPLLVVCDLNRFEIHTNFTGTAKEVHAFDLDGLADAKNLAKLRHAFTDPDQLKPGRTQKQVTEEVAAKFAAVADGMRDRGIEPHAAGHFLMKLMFCMFAEDIDLLPKELFLRTVRNCKWEPAKLSKMLADLFAAMASPGGTFGADEIPWFNGGLFKDAEVIDLTPTEIRHLEDAAGYDWSAVEPSIFGTLFERILNPAKRSQLGAHYTSRDDILTLLEPVLVAPLRREWEAVRAKADKLWEKAKGTKAGNKPKRDFEKCVFDFLDRLADVTVLDPACGSGNFLYVALHRLMDVEKEVLTYWGGRGMTHRAPLVRPTQLRGIEINEYAQELAQVVIWIGYLQWLKENGYQPDLNPVLDAMENIQNRDAVLDLTDPANPKEPDWPDAEFIVGNPPFLGYSPLRQACGNEYTDALFKLYADRLSNQSDLCCYWFEKARAMIEAKRVKRAGLLATQAIRGGKSREVLQRIAENGGMFFAISDQDWVLDGANVHISMVGFDDGTEANRQLDGKPVPSINANLTATADTTQARRLEENKGIGFVGGFKFGSFDIDDATARRFLATPSVGGRPNSDVVRPWVNGLDVLRRRDPFWIIDFGEDMPEQAAATYDAPFEHIRVHVKPERDVMRRERRRDRWWIHGEPANNLRRGLANCPRYIATPRVAKYRVFVWIDSPVQVDGQLIAFARSDDYFFGVLHSRVHEVWARSQGTQVRERESGFRYTPNTCFLTFPFPEPSDAQRETIAAAAEELDALRSNWLNPPEWTTTEFLEFPGSADGPWKRYVSDPDARGISTVRYPRVVPKDGKAAGELKKRTLTNLYNERPAWLANAHRKLDEAVFAAYGWPVNLSDDDLLAKLLELNLSRAGTAGGPPDSESD